MIDDLACQWAARIERGLDDAERTSLEQWIYADRRHRGALLRAQAALSLLDRGRALSPAEEQPDDAEPLPVVVASCNSAAAPSRRRSPAASASGCGRRGRRSAPASARSAGCALATDPSRWSKQQPAACGLHRHGRDIELAKARPGSRSPKRPGPSTFMSGGAVQPVGTWRGSVAVVNSSSRLRVAFTRNARDIELAEGEAWFEVAHNRARPFTVHAGPVRVQAVGTAFDVRRRDDGSDVTVTEGTVKLWSTASGAEPVFVRAGQRAVMTDEAGVVISSLAPATSDQSLAWREGRIVLDDMTLAAAAAEFNRYHSEQLVIYPALADKQVVGWFRTDDIDGFATASAAMVGGHVVRDRNVIRIVP